MADAKGVIMKPLVRLSLVAFMLPLFIPNQVAAQPKPVPLLQAVPLRRSASLNLTVLVGAGVILLWTLLAWLLSPLLKGAKSIGADGDRKARRLKLFIRGAAAFQVVYLVGWFLMLRPLLNSEIEFYTAGADGWIRALQVGGLLVIAAAALGLWSAWRLSALGVSRFSKVTAWLVAASLVGVVWIAFMGGFLGFSVNY